MTKSLKVLAIGDIVGRTGRNVIESHLQSLIDRERVDFVIVNGENAAGGISITPKICQGILAAGVNVITTGNHVWDNQEVYKIIESESSLLRPANYPDRVQGKGYVIKNCRGFNICVINLQGRVHMAPLDCPFVKFDAIYEKIKSEANIVIVDFHAEATAEKRALGWYLDGRASLVFGTHTHVQTADEQIQPKGCGYISDIGMTGSSDSVIGMNKEQSIMRFLTHQKVKYEIAPGGPMLNGIIACFEQNGMCTGIRRVYDVY